jgi:hypothetical protein
MHLLGRHLVLSLLAVFLICTSQTLAQQQSSNNKNAGNLASVNTTTTGNATSIKAANVTTNGVYHIRAENSKEA